MKHLDLIVPAGLPVGRFPKGLTKLPGGSGSTDHGHLALRTAATAAPAPETFNPAEDDDAHFRGVCSGGDQ